MPATTSSSTRDENGVLLGVTGSWRRLRDGSWGIRTRYTTRSLEGETVRTVRRDGSTSTVLLGRRTQSSTERDVALYRVERTDRDGRQDGSAAYAEIVGRAAREREDRARQAEELPLPSESTRAGRMLIAGRLVATVTLPDGDHVTLEVRARRSVGGRRRPCSILDPGANVTVTTRSGYYVGRIGERFAISWGRGITVATMDAVRALFGFAREADDEGGYGAYRIQVEDRCGRCGRPLTDPVSIERGIGPECFGRSTGSRHAEVVGLRPADRSQEIAENYRAVREAGSTPIDEARERLGLGSVLVADVAPDRSLSDLAASIAAPAADANRELIAKALRAYAEDEMCDESQVNAALRAYDRRAS